MNTDQQLIRLSETGRFWRLAFEDLTPAEQVFRSVWDLEAEVNNGGFDQYYLNGAGDTAPIVVAALLRIGAERTARIVEEALGVFPDAASPRDRDERQALLGQLTTDQRAVWERLDQEFVHRPDDLTELLLGFVRRNATDIDGASAAGIPPAD